MLLVVDTGNTNTVMAVHDGDTWRGVWRISTNSQRTSDEYWVWLQAMLAASGIKPRDITGAVIGTVVPAALYDIRRLCRDWLEVEPLVARANLERDGLRGVELKQGDIYALPVERNSFDLVIVHQVLHFLDDPARAVREAAHVLAPGGLMILVDFAPHDLEFLRDTQAHRRLGFSAVQMTDWLKEAGLDLVEHQNIAPPMNEGGQLTVSVFTAKDPRLSIA